MLKRITKWVTCILILLFKVNSFSFAGPVASFTADQNSGCLPLNVQFTSTSAGAVSYYWDLGNGNSSTLANPSNLYTSPGSFTVTLIAYDAAGNADTARYTNFISVSGKPTANFSVSHTTACPDNNSFLFTNTSFGGATTYLWDFGDGTTSSQVNPSHSYSYSGQFTVTLLAMNTSGCQDIKIQNQLITIYPKPDATVHANSTANCDAATVFQFSNNATNALTWNWSFGDNSSSGQQNPTHHFPGPGNYNVSVIVTNTNGCIDTSDSPVAITVGLNNWADYSYDVDSGCEDLTVNFTNTNTNVSSSFWDFGDGATANNSWPSHTYTNPGAYTVTLIVTTTTGCADTVVKTNLIHVGQKPDADFSVTTTTGCAPLTTQFINNSSGFTSCKWYFGDGSTSTATSPTHTYSVGGIYTVTLECTGNTGCVSSMTKTALVTVTSPQVVFNASPRVGCPPLTSNFSTATPPSPLTYLWNFGDGASSTSSNPSHTYTTSGTFDVTLTVTDAIGCTNTVTRSSFIQTINPAANYVPPPTTIGCVPLTAQFTDGAIGGSSWNWDFGDGITSNLQNPVHVYSTPGTYTVSLTTVSNGGGCAQSIGNFSTFQVEGGYAGFTHTETVCPPYISTFQDTSQNAVSWLWDFGDGTTSTLQNPVHTFNSPGYHSISLIITTAAGCTYSSMQSNSVYFQPFGANFYGVAASTGYPRNVDFYANSVGATSWLWDFGDGDTSTLENPSHIYQVYGNYDVTLTISNGVCTLTYNPPPYHFGQPDSSHYNTGHGAFDEEQKGCAPLDVFFTNRINGAVTWLWDFGDGQSSNDPFPIHTYLNPGIYSVTLTTSDTLGIVQTLQLDSIVKVAGPHAGFAISQTPSCSSSQVIITDTSVNASHWQWDMGDGTTDTVQNPFHLYNSSLSNYIITQTVTDTAGCSASVSTSIFSSFVSPLLASQTDVCGYDTISFFTSLQNYQSYVWDFGDGNTSNVMSPSYVYQTEGTFTVTLKVTDLGGCVQTFTLNPAISVRIPHAAFTTAGPRETCNINDVTFINTSANADVYEWNFGDGNIASQTNPQHAYQPGVYDVTLTVYRGSCMDRATFPAYIKVDTAHADFTYTIDQVCSPVTATFADHSVNPSSWYWTFGDTATSTLQNPVHTYYDRLCCLPRLVMTDINGCIDTANALNMPIISASFTTSADSGCFPFTVQFTNTANLVIDHWQWFFGDGSSSTLPNPSHTYTTPGTYDVTLIVWTSTSGCYDTLTMPAKIVVRQPHSDFVSTDIKACAPSLVNFTNLSNDGDSYLWDFGDGTTSTNYNPSHIYNVPGNYSVKLVSSSRFGCADSIVKTNYILVEGPITNFTASTFQGCFPLEVTFTDNSTNAVSYSWNFGDGNTDFTQNPVHVFNDTGSFTASLVTSDTSGCTSYYELPQSVVVRPTPVASIISNVPGGCQPVTATFTNTSTNYNSFTWYFGDGDTSTSQTVQHTFTDAGTYDVHLIATNGFGCNDTARLDTPFTIYPVPIPQFTASDALGCLPFHVTFTNLSANLENANYLWDFGNGDTSTDINPAIDFIHPGSYSISLTVTNQSGCTASVIYPSMIHTGDTLPPAEVRILDVTVMSNTSVKIIWENVTDADLNSYVIYRSSPWSNGFQPINSINNVQNNAAGGVTEYTDNTVNALSTSYTYKVLALDTCANSIPLDSVIGHTTINISSQSQDSAIFVSWSPYGGC